MTTDELLTAIGELLPEFKTTGAVMQLSGGNINNVWRVDGDPDSLIAKHAPPHIATNPDVPLSIERLSFEAKALSLFSSGGQLASLARQQIRPPELIAFDPDRSLLLMEDVEAFAELNWVPTESISPKKTGQRLGQFIGNLHRKTFMDHELRNTFANFEIQQVRHQLQYEPAHEYGNWNDASTKTKIKKRSRDLGERLQGTGTCLVMGDLWPPSILVNKESDIRLIDWEFVHFGRPLQDIGHFAAHCRMQGQIAETSTADNWWNELWRSFIGAYKVTTGDLYSELMNSEEKEDIGIHIGTEILVRAFGPFKKGYVYEPFEKGHIVLENAQKGAEDFICNPISAVESFGF